jgi:tetratricopeptide (TPR) repeat protein
MTRNPSARRVHRQSSAPDDAFIAGVLESTAWAQQHRRALIIGGVLVAAAAVAIAVTFSMRSSRNAESARRLIEVRAVALSGNNQLAIRDLEQFVSAYGGTRAANEARLMLGRAYLQEGQTQPAIDAIQKLAGDLDNILGVNGAFLLGAAHEAANQPQRAEETYLRIGDDAPYLYLQQEGLDNAARVRLQAGNAAGAAEIYERILAMTPETDQNRPVYELRLGEARTAAGAGPTTAAAPTTGS